MLMKADSHSNRPGLPLVQFADPALDSLNKLAMGR